MVRKILLLRPKGGVGQTTVAIALALLAHRFGRRVLLVDANPHSGIAASMPVERLGFTLRSLPAHSLPTDAALADWIGATWHRLSESDYDLLLIDSPHRHNGFAMRACLQLGDEILVVTRTEPLALRLLPPLLEWIHQEIGQRPSLRFRGIVLIDPPGEPCPTEWTREVESILADAPFLARLPYVPELAHWGVIGPPNNVEDRLPECFRHLAETLRWIPTHPNATSPNVPSSHVPEGASMADAGDKTSALDSASVGTVVHDPLVPELASAETVATHRLEPAVAAMEVQSETDSWTPSHRSTESIEWPKPAGSTNPSDDSGSEHAWLAAGGAAGQLLLWDLLRGLHSQVEWTTPFREIQALTFVDQGRQLVVAGTEGGLSLFDLGDRREARPFVGHSGSVTAVGIAPNGPLLASASLDQTIRLWHLQTGEAVACWTGHKGPVTCLAFSPDGLFLASGSWDRTLRVWEVATGKELVCFRAHEKMVTAVAFAPDGRSLATGGWDKLILIWELSLREPLLALQGNTLAVASIHYLPDGLRLVSGGWDGTVRLWDVTTGEQCRCLRSSADPLRAIALADDGQALASCGADGKVRLWDLVGGVQRATLQPPLPQANAVAFAPLSPGLRATKGARSQVLRSL